MKSFELENAKWAYLKMAPTFLICVFLLCSCDLLKPAAQKKAEKPKDPNIEAAAEPSSLDVMTQGEKFAFHRWLVTEMLEQIFGRPVKGQEEVDAWANVFSQRGSMEGVYHGMVLSTDYASLETGRANLKALRFFAQEMAAMDHPNSQDSDEAVRAAAAKYAKDYMGQPLFTLKRLMGDRVIQESNARKGDKDRLATWYSNFVGRWIKAGVPFGMPQRENTDQAFHFRWAKENSLGMLQWELLNRVHRVLNALGGVALPAPAAKPATPAGK